MITTFFYRLGTVLMFLGALVTLGLIGYGFYLCGYYVFVGHAFDSGVASDRIWLGWAIFGFIPAFAGLITTLSLESATKDS